MPYLCLKKITIWPQMASLLINTCVFISNKFCGIELFKFISKLTSFCESKVNHLQVRADDFWFVIHIWNSCFIQSLWINTRGISLLPEHTETFVASVTAAPKDDCLSLWGAPKIPQTEWACSLNIPSKIVENLPSHFLVMQQQFMTET